MKNSITTAALGILLVYACSPSKQADKQSVTEEKTMGQEVSYAGDSIEMKGYLANLQNGTDKVPGILVVHEWWGHNEYARSRADKLASLGYVALAVDMFGDGKTAGHPSEAGEFTMQVMSDIPGATERFESAMKLLKEHPNVDPEKIGAIGYCFGGSVVLTMANSGMDLDAVAAFHSGVQLPVAPEEGRVTAKILICNGLDDPFIPAESVTAYQEALDNANAVYEYIAYPGVLHAFTNPGADELGAKFELPLKYDAEADSLSWEKMKGLFASVFMEEEL